VPQFEEDMASPEVQQALDEARGLAEKLGVQGTPFYLIGDRNVPGAPDDLYDQLTAKVAEVRKQGCKAKC
jgi:protein-disulfide isomerase